MYTFNFTSKAQYLAQKKEWHTAFIAQIQKIRTLKNSVKTAQREHESVYPAYRAIAVAHTEFNELLTERIRSRARSYKQMIAENPNAVSFHDRIAA